MRFSFLATLAFAAVSFAAPVERAPAIEYKTCNSPGVFALTFDDGPNQYSYELAKSLRQQGIKATFFINGNNAVDVLGAATITTSDGPKTYLEVIKYYDEAGHEVASHTYKHLRLTGLSEAQIREEMDLQSEVIFRAIGRRPTLMRPPEGALDELSNSVIGNLGYSNVNWDLDTKDYEGNLIASQHAVTSIMEHDVATTPGHISLLHDIHQQTVDVLTPWLIKYVQSKGLRFVTISDCIGIPAYR